MYCARARTGRPDARKAIPPAPGRGVPPKPTPPLLYLLLLPAVLPSPLSPLPPPRVHRINATLRVMQDEPPHTTSPRKDYSRAALSLVLWAIVLVSGPYLAGWAWEQPFMAKPRMGWELSRMP